MKTAIVLMLAGLSATTAAALVGIQDQAAVLAAFGGIGIWAAAVAAMPWSTTKSTGRLRSAMAAVGVVSFAGAIATVTSQDTESGRVAAEIGMIAGANLGFPLCFAIMLLAVRRNVIRIR